MTQPARLYTPESLAERWQCSAAHVRAMIRRGELIHFRLGKLLRISAEEVARCESQGSSDTWGSSPSDSSTPRMDSGGAIRLARQIRT